MLRNIAKAISAVMHPMLVPIFAMLFVFYGPLPWAYMSGDYKSTVVLFASFGMCVIPLLFIGILMLLEMVTDVEMPSKRERILPIFVTMLSLVATYYVMVSKAGVVVLEPITALILSELSMLILAFIITPFWKISLHAMGLGALLVFVIFICMLSKTPFHIQASIIFIISGLVAWARLYLDAHSQMQLVVGYMLGALSSLFAMSNIFLGV